MAARQDQTLQIIAIILTGLVVVFFALTIWFYTQNDNYRQEAEAANQKALKQILNAVFATRPARDWLDSLAAQGVPCSPINAYSQVLSDPHVAEQQWVQPLRLPNGQETQTFASPLRIDGSAPAIRRGPPDLDGDRAAVLELVQEMEKDRAAAAR